MKGIGRPVPFLLPEGGGYLYPVSQAFLNAVKRNAIEKTVPENDPLKDILNPERYTIDNEVLLKQLCGLR